MTNSLKIEVDLFHGLGAVIRPYLEVLISVYEKRHLLRRAVPDPDPAPLVVEGV